MSMSTKGRILCPMLWRIFWPSKVSAARSRDNSAVTPFNVSSMVVTSCEALGSLCLVKHDARLMCHCNRCVTLWLWDDNMPYQYIQDQPQKLDVKPLPAFRKSAAVALCLSPPVWLGYIYNATKRLNQEARRQCKPLPITLTQCWYILIIFGGEKAYRLSCTSQMETNHNNIEQGAVWPT